METKADRLDELGQAYTALLVAGRAWCTSAEEVLPLIPDDVQRLLGASTLKLTETLSCAGRALKLAERD